VNVSRKPEEWQSYDIIFHAPKCSGGSVSTPGTLTLLHNGVLIQDHVTIKGPTPGAVKKTYASRLRCDYRITSTRRQKPPSCVSGTSGIAR
jgi:hypothetical protein